MGGTSSRLETVRQQIYPGDRFAQRNTGKCHFCLYDPVDTNSRAEQERMCCLLRLSPVPVSGRQINPGCLTPRLRSPGVGFTSGQAFLDTFK